MSFLAREGPGATNVGPRGRHRRRFLGFVALGAAAVLLGLFALADASAAWGLAVGVLVGGGALGLLEAREETCVRLALRGVRDPDTGEEPVVHSAERALLRKQAGAVLLYSALVGVGGGLVGFLLLVV